MHAAYLRHRTPPKASKKHVGAHWRTVANFGGVVMLNCYAISLGAAPARKAEGVRFELTRPFGLPVFKTGAINRSATPPEKLSLDFAIVSAIGNQLQIVGQAFRLPFLHREANRPPYN